MKKIKWIITTIVTIVLLSTIVILSACNPTNESNEKEPENIVEEALAVPYDLSSTEYDFEKKYFVDDYNTKHSSFNVNVFGEDENDVVFETVTYEKLVGILESEGNYLFFFGGSWCHNTRAAAAYVNQYALELGVKTVYNFDFYLDGTNSSSHVRVTNSNSTAPGVQYNYLYGELITRYLTNLNDWVQYVEGSNSDVDYNRPGQTEATIEAKLQVPFLFLYNKDNTVRNVPTRDENLPAWHNQTGIHAEQGEENEKYPIVYGFEEMVDRDAEGVYYNVNRQKTYATEAYSLRVKGIFDYISENNIVLSYYSDADYIRDFYNKKSGKEIFKTDDQINIHVINYRQLDWLLRQEGNALILFGGTWCPNTQAVIATINDYAVANNLIVYNFDTKLDSGYAKKYWGYSGDVHIRDSANPFVKLYANLVETYLPNLITLYDVNSDQSYQYISYTSEDEEVRVKKLQVPYLFAYNKDAKEANEVDYAPILGYYEEMLTIADATAEDYVYQTDNYARYKNGVYNVIQAYFDAEDSGITARQIKVDRSK